MTQQQTIEDIILQEDRRGVSALRPHLPPDYCTQAARLILENPGRAVITTGFYILSGGAPETDGPPGAIAIGRALQQTGYQVWYVTDKHALFTLEGELQHGARVLEFPIADEQASQAFARKLLGDIRPSVLISIERCGMTRDGRYLNMRGRDISQYTARLDHLFRGPAPSVGIGDGGNEIGMGNLYDQVRRNPPLPSDPAATQVSRLVIASVSNWGGYGLVAALSLLKGQNLLLSVEEEASLIRSMVDSGAVDGFSGERTYKVDGFPLEENSRTLEALHRLVRDRLKGA